MSLTVQANRKANVKQKTDADILSSIGQPVVNRADSVSSAAQTVINLSYIVDTNSKENFELYIDGKILTFGATSDYVFTSISGGGFSSQVTLNAPLAAGLNISAIKRGVKKEVEFATDSRFIQNYDLMTAGFQGFVDESSKLTAVNGAPGAGQFRSSVVGRASIPDLTNDLKARMGVDRIQTQNAFELQNEFGPAGERVFGVLNDDRGLIRYVGSWTNLTDVHGSYAFSAATLTDYLEITFYGTGLNLLSLVNGTVRDYRVSVDGGAEGGNISLTASAVLTSRNYAVNQILPAASGLTLGLHTVKIRNNAATAGIVAYAFEILNESANVNVRPGTAYQNGKKLVLSAASSVAYNSGFETVTREDAAVAFSSTRGARVLEYLKSDGTKGKAAYLTNSAQANLGSADHTYEEIVRKYSPREFGAGRADDFSSLTGTAAVHRFFTLDDGCTSLCSNNAALSDRGTFGLGEYLTTGVIGDNIILTFVGTGLDFTGVGHTSGTMAVTIDGVSAGTIAALTNGVKQNVKVVSGLPYGSHCVKLVSAGTNAGIGIAGFSVYGPKKPTLPAGAAELADYNVMADYSSAGVGGTALSDNADMAVGVLNKGILREVVYVGTWVINAVASNDNPHGANNTTTTNGDYFEYTFFGTGIVLHLMDSSAGTSTWTATIDGVVNASAVDTLSITNNGAGSYTVNTTVNARPVRLAFTSLALTKHTLRIAKTAGTGGILLTDIGIITPIHSPKSNFQADLQNTLPVGSCGISDSRKLSPVKSENPAKAWAQAVGITSAPSTTSTAFIPAPDLSITMKTGNSILEIDLLIGSMNVTSTGQAAYFRIYIDGIDISGTPGEVAFQSANGTTSDNLSSHILVPVSSGTHKIDVYWRSSSASTISLNGINRLLSVREA